MDTHEYKFVIDKPYLNFDSEISHCAILGPETPLPANEHAHVRVLYDRDRAPHEVAAILRELADLIAHDPEFNAADARRALTDPKFGTGVYHPSYEQRMRMIAEVYPADGDAPSQTRVDELKDSLRRLSERNSREDDDYEA